MRPIIFIICFLLIIIIIYLIWNRRKPTANRKITTLRTIKPANPVSKSEIAEMLYNTGGQTSTTIAECSLPPSGFLCDPIYTKNKVMTPEEVCLFGFKNCAEKASLALFPYCCPRMKWQPITSAEQIP